MFQGCPVVSNVCMFQCCPVVSNVFMFQGCPVVSNVCMFQDCPVVSNVYYVSGCPVVSNVVMFQGCPVVSNVCIYGDSSKSYVVGIVCPVPEQLTKLAAKYGKSNLSFIEQCQVIKIDHASLIMT